MELRAYPCREGDDPAARLAALAEGREDGGRAWRGGKIVRDTTNFFGVDFGDVLALGERLYLVRSNEREGRFGLDEEPKFWVKRAVDLETERLKVVKLGFRESFRARAGSMTFECLRSPRKEARILRLTRGDDRFMQGYAERDCAGNLVRVIDFISGSTLSSCVEDLGEGHEEYYHRHLGDMLEGFRRIAEGIGDLHRRGEKHGDIRRDHVIVERGSGLWKWIDFDFNFHHPSKPFGYDLLGLGNLLLFLVGRGDVLARDFEGGRGGTAVAAEDLNVLFPNRVANLRKVYPWVGAGINRVLMHFSAGAAFTYERVGDLLEELGEVAPSTA